MNKEHLYLPISIIIGSLLIAGSIVYTKTPQSFSQLGRELQARLPEAPLSSPQQKDDTITKADHVRGDFDAPVTLVEYSDFQCPFCKRFHPTVQRILAEYPGKVRWVYRHFPLDQIHPQARAAAEASECVFEQKGNEGFWQFADALFENQSRLGEALYKELAGNLGVNMSQFENCITTRKYQQKVKADYQAGIKAGVRGTPGNFVNGKAVHGAVPYESLKAVIDQALADLE